MTYSNPYSGSGRASNARCAFDDAGQAPALVLRQRTALFDGDGIALVALVVLVVGEQLGRLANELAPELLGVKGSQAVS